jgi:hypothetical protein
MKTSINTIFLMVIGSLACIGSTKNDRCASFKVFPLISHLHYTYDYYSEYSVASIMDGVTERVVDSGYVEYIVHDSTVSNDTTAIWNIEQRQRIQHKAYNTYGSPLDTTYWIDDTTFFILTEKTIGFHELTATSLIWQFPLVDPLKSQSIFRFSDSTTAIILGFWNVNTPDCGYGTDSLWFSEKRGFMQRESQFIYGWCHNTHHSGSTHISLRGDPVLSVRELRTIPFEAELKQNYPNPFNPSTIISFSLPRKAFVTLKIYDLLGREITTLISGELQAGNHFQRWNAVNIPSGIYFYCLQAGSFKETKKVILLK